MCSDRILAEFGVSIAPDGVLSVSNLDTLTPVNCRNLATLLTPPNQLVIWPHDDGRSRVWWPWVQDDPLRTYVKRRRGEWLPGETAWAVVAAALPRVEGHARALGYRTVHAPSPTDRPWHGAVVDLFHVDNRSDAPVTIAVLDVRATVRRRGLSTAYQAGLLRGKQFWLLPDVELLTLQTSNDLKWPTLMTRPVISPGMANELRNLGAKVNEHRVDADLQRRWRDMSVKVIEWLPESHVEIRADVRNPLHWLCTPPRFKDWAGISHQSVASWNYLREQLGQFGVRVEQMAVGPAIDVIPPENVPGWTTRARNTLLLNEHQKTGAMFCVERKMRAIVGDEMGTGKTGLAIAAAGLAGVQRVLVVCPTSALDAVWRKDIIGWSASDGPLPHIAIAEPNNTIDLPPRGWAVVSYDDLLTQRVQALTLKRDRVASALRAAITRNRLSVNTNMTAKTVTFSFRADEKTIHFLKRTKSQRKTQLRRIADQLALGICQQIHVWAPDLLIIDEAHRIKNPEALRSVAVQQMASDPTRGVVLLTGTPLRNHGGEAAALLDVIAPGIDAVLAGSSRWPPSDGSRLSTRDKRLACLLETVMIRRPKGEVLPNLPPKVRSRLDLTFGSDPQTQMHLGAYHEAMEYAQEAFSKALNAGGTEGDARKAAMPGWSTASRHLGLAKVEHPETMDIIREIVRRAGRMVVFAHHHQVIDLLRTKLEDAGLTVVTLTGRTPRADRVATVEAFQSGNIEVFLGGIEAAGESISLTAADTVLFVELPWVPATLLQAEDRPHRPGQYAKYCNIIHVIAEEEIDQVKVETMNNKIALIDAMLGERTDLIAPASDQSAIELLSKNALQRHRQRYALNS